MQPLKRILLIVAILIACVGCDQTTKSLARDYLQDRGTVSFLGDTLRLQYAENPGAFLSLGSSLPRPWRAAAFTIGGILMITAVLLYAFLYRKSGRIQIVALSLICGGGIGNLIDRVRYDGHVTDFLNMGVASIRTGIFNVADVMLMAGVALIVLRYRRSPPSVDTSRVP
jgi:signal peptidase II